MLDNICDAKIVSGLGGCYWFLSRRSFVCVIFSCSPPGMWLVYCVVCDNVLCMYVENYFSHNE
jgi:hypothetical protein